MQKSSATTARSKGKRPSPKHRSSVRKTRRKSASLCNRAALRTELIGAHEHESHYVFDICYRNTTDIVPTTITGDMHSISKANFAATFWFDMGFAPRFTNLPAQLKHVYCGDDLACYQDFLIKPAGQIERGFILDEPAHIEQIIASLSLKEMSQQTLMRKLCALAPSHPVRRAVFEFDKLVRSRYTLQCLLDPQRQRDARLSQKRLEAYHALRGSIAEVSGKKHLIGRTDLEIAISNGCGRLLANIVIAFNSIVLSELYERCQRSGNQTVLSTLKTIRPSPGSTFTSSDTTSSGTAPTRSIWPPCSPVSTSYNRLALPDFHLTKNLTC
ncbi:Tn3 family transposase [Paraburkholderia aspalathi]|uniref:Tn3 family transposase n=1 Tax=Paraburkholderia aspalathi TaxID=1324617 RepID=UPI0038B738B9